MPVAFALGHHPAFEVAAGSNCAWGTDEYEFAGGLMDSPLRVTESGGLAGADFFIPADAEIVVEGRGRSQEKRNLRAVGGRDALLFAPDARTGVHAHRLSDAQKSHLHRQLDRPRHVRRSWAPHPMSTAS